MEKTYVSRVVKTDHSIITVIRPVLSDEERERRMKELTDTIKEVFGRMK